MLLGNLGVEVDHPPKMCAGLLLTTPEPLETFPTPGTAGSALAPLMQGFANTNLARGPSATSLLSTENTLHSAASAAQGGAVCFLRLKIVAEVVGEAQHLQLHDGRSELDKIYVPRPLVFVPPPALDDDPFLSPRSLEPADDGASAADRPGTPESALVKARAARSAMGFVFQDLLKLFEIKAMFRMLPKKPVVPLYVELKDKPSLVDRVREACGDCLKEGGRIALGDLRQSLVDLGCKATISETKQFFRHLHDEEATVVDLAEYVEELTPDVALAIITALDDTEHAHRLAVQLERHEARLREMAGDQTNAATKLQNITRSRKARQTVAHKRYERSKKGQAEREGATALQSTFRARQSRLAAKAAAKKRLDTTAKRLLGDPAFQGMVHSCIEGTLFNLIQEALHNEFELTAAPVQRLLPR